MSDDFDDFYDFGSEEWERTFDLFPDDGVGLTDEQIETATDMIMEMLEDGWDWDDIWDAMDDFWDWYEEFYG